MRNCKLVVTAVLVGDMNMLCTAAGRCCWMTLDAVRICRAVLMGDTWCCVQLQVLLLGDRKCCAQLQMLLWGDIGCYAQLQMLLWGDIRCCVQLHVLLLMMLTCCTQLQGSVAG